MVNNRYLLLFPILFEDFLSHIAYHETRDTDAKLIFISSYVYYQIKCKFMIKKNCIFIVNIILNIKYI